MTIKDIAKLANVSVSTVSKILNNKDADISEETRKKVLKYVKEYQYTPYSKIKGSVLGRSYTFGLILPGSLEYKDVLISAVEEAGIKNGYHTLIYFTSTEEEEEKYLRMLTVKNVEAVLLYSIGDSKKAIEILQKENIPLILLKEVKDDRTSAQIYIDYKDAGYIATSHLIQYNHRNIGLLLCGKNEESEMIKQGYIEALYKNDILYDSNKVFEGQNEQDAGNIGTHQFINMNVTAIVCGNEKIACSVYQTCTGHGLQIPKDISVVSIGGSEWAEVLKPRLDVVDLAIKDIGQNAVEAMLGIIESKSVPNSLSKKVEVSLVKRESVSNLSKYNIQNKKIIVVGSMNMDVTINVNSIPTSGETLISDNVVLLPGGKGANQAVGAGRLGGLVYAIGCLGNDNDGKKIYNNLVNNSVKTDGIHFTSHLPTGKAYINVAKDGESTIVVYPGANNSLDKHQIKKHRKLFEGAEFCLLSLEISKKTAEYTIDLCQETKTKVIVKPSTIEELEDRILKKIDYLVPNEKELHRLVPGDYSVSQKAEILYNKGVKNVIVTLGSKGCYLRNKDYSISFAAAPFEAFDTTGAADAFISALAVFLSEGNDLITAIHYALYSAGISITRAGAQPSMPDRMTLDMYRNDIINAIKQILN